MRNAFHPPWHPIVPGVLALSSIATPAAVIHVPGDQPTIQAGIDAAAKRDTVLVAPGTYFESVNLRGKVVTLASEAGAQSTIIDAGQADAVVTFSDGGSGHGRRLRHAHVNGFTLRNGLVGVSMKGGYLKVEDCIITGNAQAAVHAWLANIDVIHNLIRDNANDGVVLVTPKRAHVDDNRIESNGGTGVVLERPHLTIVARNVIRGNSGPKGAGLRTSGPDGVDVADNLIVGNHGSDPDIQAGVYVDAGTKGFGGGWANNTIADNGGVQLYMRGNVAPIHLLNNVIASTHGGIAFQCEAADGVGGIPTANNNDFWSRAGRAVVGVCRHAMETAPGTLEVDPQFQGTGPGSHWKPLAGSPLIDAGDNAIDGRIFYDIRGNPRILGGVVDMGAFEFEPG